MVEALILGAMMETIGLGTRPMACTFPGTQVGEDAIEVVLTPRPSLKDLPGLYRVEMAVNGALRLPAAAQPITTTDQEDIMVRASDRPSRIYTVGVDAKGNAALNLLVRDDPNAAPHEAMRVGHCRNYQKALKKWSALE